jgi:hypothetical protein
MTRSVPTFRALADEDLAKWEARAAAPLTEMGWLLAFAKAEFGDELIADTRVPLVLRVLTSRSAW